MAWLRKGDNAATHPLVMAFATVKDTDERLMNEAVGFVQRCAEQSAGHMTDGVIDLGTVIMMGGPTRWAPLVDACVEAGLLTRKARGKKPTWEIPKDADFIHIRSRSEIEWEKQRKRDAANPALTVPVRRRDGDGCRYCGEVVNWGQRRGGRRGTYDHRDPGQPATYETYVVACFTCNSVRTNNPNADTVLPLLPPPVAPFYSEYSRKFLANNGVDVPELTRPRPGIQPANAAPPATREPAASEAAQPERHDAKTRPTRSIATPQDAASAAAQPERHDAMTRPAQAAQADPVWPDTASATPPPAWARSDDATRPDPIGAARQTGPPGPAWELGSADLRRNPQVSAEERSTARDGSGRDGTGTGQGVGQVAVRPARSRGRRKSRGGRDD